MRCLKRNKSRFFYKTYLGETPILDDDGYKTGEYEQGYSDPVETYANISPASGSTYTEMFGRDVSCDKIIVTDELDCPISESSLLYIDRLPTEGEADYVVSRVSKSLNSISYAVKKVDIE